MIQLSTYATAMGLAVGLLVVVNGQEAAGPQPFGPAASWQTPTSDHIRAALMAWCDEIEIGDGARREVMEFLQSCESELNRPATERLDLILRALAIIHPQVRALLDSTAIQPPAAGPLDLRLLDDPNVPGLVRDHARLWYARWLVQNHMYDEALEQFQALPTESLLDPATKLFYQALALHQLHDKDCVPILDQLLENPDQLPRRFLMLARLMRADIGQLQEDSLDEIARMMSDIRRRQQLYRAGKIVLGKEQEVIEKLDQLIDKLQQQQSAQAQGNSTSPAKPMDDSQSAGGQGAGEVTNRSVDEGGDWGDLPPAQRAAALAEMAKDLPPHYREVIEEYFRQLAREKSPARCP
jgi:hypothetical protein